jgi:glucose-6-phosphate 1-dehydrogenase
VAAITPVCPFDMVVFGGSGDLAMRKLMPALYYRHRDGQLPSHGRIIGVARREWSRADYVAKVEEFCRKYLPAKDFDEALWRSFADRIDYALVDASMPTSFINLRNVLASSDEVARVFYLATAPDLFGPICRELENAGLVTPYSRVVLEKPLGHDLESAEAINEAVGAVFDEQQIYRIDHYLGKETVQNLMVLRFGNALFEPLWSNAHIDHVQISVAESIGVESRGGFYDKAGAMRDMIQNHLLQLLCIVAMEPPLVMDPNSVRDEKLKVLRALKPIVGGQEVAAKTVRGQYRSGAVSGMPVKGYLEEDGIDADSRTETFVAIKAEINNWRWAGVPFYLRTGKRLAKRVSEIIVHFKEVPHSIFDPVSGTLAENQLIIRLQPDDGIKFRLMAKEPGPGMHLRPVFLNLNFADAFKQRQPDAYERLLMDVIRGKPTLFMRRDELYAAWRWVEPIMQAWSESGAERPKPYNAGTWGPTASIALIERDGYNWYEESL